MPAILAEQMEHAIECPSSNQSELFLDFEWFVPVWNGKPWLQSNGPLFSVQYLFTSAERLAPLRKANEQGKQYQLKPYSLTTEDGWQRCRPMNYQPAIDECELVPIAGRILFPQILESGAYYPEARINPCCGTHDEPHKHGQFYLPSGSLYYLTHGIDPRPETRVLRARSIREIHQFMSYTHGVHQPSHRLEYLNGELVATYEGLDINSKWKVQSFFPVEPSNDKSDMACSQSEILCGATLAFHVHNRSSQIPDNKNPIYRRDLRLQIPDLMFDIEDLFRMIDPDSDRIAPRFFRNEFSNLLRIPFPNVLERASIEAAREKFLWFLQTTD